MAKRNEFDVLIIGAGIAGGSAAIKLADEGFKVAVLKRSDRERESSTSFAQGGIIGEGENDSPELLAKDIDRAGDEVGSEKAIEILSSEGPKLVDDFLIKRLGVNFDTDSSGQILKTYEAAHARARIFHHKDQTGWEIQKSITKVLLSHPNITLFPNHTAVDLISTTHHTMKRGAKYGPTKILGAYALDLNEKVVRTILASKVIIATGGIGALWLRSSNPAGARGDGIAIAARAGASVINMEYMQFHPTAFAVEGAPSFLISEAVRGEGGVLRDDKSKRFMFDFIPEESKLEIADNEEEANRWYLNKSGRRPPELMPRDEVTRAIASHMRKGRSIFLDLSLIRERGVDLEKRFPDIFKWCMEYGVDIRRDSISVSPAAHYLCGGIRVDEFGKTDKENLYAAGECSCTGLHGANRLASTSLLEGLTWGIRSAKHIIGTFKKEDFEDWKIPDWDDSGILPGEADVKLCHYKLEHIGRIMWEHAGIVRSGGGLLLARFIFAKMEADVENLYWRCKLSDDLIGWRNSLEVALMVVTQARRNKFNCGCHFREDGLN